MRHREDQPWPSTAEAPYTRAFSVLAMRCQEPLPGQTLQAAPCWHRLLGKLEGIVSKRIDRPYRSGPTKDWITVKCSAWREENAWRHPRWQQHIGGQGERPRALLLSHAKVASP
jgi:hypothetical protein